MRRIEDRTDLRAKTCADLAAAQRDHKGADAAYILLADEAAEPNALIGQVRQMVSVGIDVVIAARNFRRETGAGAVEDIEAARDAVMAALLGWQPPDADGPVTYRRGRMVDFSRATVWWQMQFEAPVLISQ